MERSTRALIVEDYTPFRQLLRTALRQAGFEIVGEASNGLDAIENAQNLHPELMLLDIGLPGLDGIEVARRIRKLSPNIKILVVSENRSLEIIAEVLRSADGYLLKSDVGRELLTAVESVLDSMRFISEGLTHLDLGPLTHDDGEGQTGRNEDAEKRKSG